MMLNNAFYRLKKWQKIRIVGILVTFTKVYMRHWMLQYNP